MKTKNIMLGILLILGAVFSTVFVSAYMQGNVNGLNNVNQTNLQRGFDEDRHNKMLEIIENKDYQAFKELNEGRRILEIVTEDNFDKFVEMHTLKLNGDFERANEIKSELGLGIGKGSGNGNGNGKHLMTNRGLGQNPDCPYR